MKSDELFSSSVLVLRRLWREPFLNIDGGDTFVLTYDGVTWIKVSGVTFDDVKSLLTLWIVWPSHI